MIFLFHFSGRVRTSQHLNSLVARRMRISHASNLFHATDNRRRDEEDALANGITRKKRKVNMGPLRKQRQRILVRLKPSEGLSFEKRSNVAVKIAKKESKPWTLSQKV